MIIGYGNPDRGDDAAGILAARRLRDLGVNAIEHTGDGLALMELWTGGDDVTVIDAIVSGFPPGSVRMFEDGPSLNAPTFLCSTHNFGLMEAIRLSRALGRLPRRLRIYGIEAAQWEPGAPPSAEVAAAVEQVAREIGENQAATLSLTPKLATSGFTRSR